MCFSFNFIVSMCFYLNFFFMINIILWYYLRQNYTEKICRYKLNGKLCKRRKTVVVGADAKAHRTIWGSSDINKRDESLLDIILINKLNICNSGDEPAFITALRKEFFDVTLSGSPNMINVVKD